MRINTNIPCSFYALYKQGVKQHFNNIPLGFTTLKMNLMRYVTLTLLLIGVSLRSMAQVGPIVGPSALCIGDNITYTDTTAGGTWSSGTPSVATINAVTGSLTGISAGITTITYTGSSVVTATITVDPLPSAIASPSSLCLGNTITAVNTTSGGAWSSSNTAIAVIGSSGIVTGISPGAASIQYTMPGGCSANMSLTVNPSPSPISGSTSVCTGNSVALFNSVPGGEWSSSSPGVATIGSSTGALSGISAGTATIYYGISTCVVSTLVTVNSLPGSISGTPNTCQGNNTTLFCGTVGGLWSSGSTAVATVGSSSGVIYGVSSGTTSISYILPTGCMTSKLVSVNPVPSSYSISPSTATYCTGGSGVPVSVSNSQTGISYQLFRGFTPVGAPSPGTGTAINFGSQTGVGSYSVRATNPITGCFAWMSGSSLISTYPLPTAFNVSGGGAFCAGSTGRHIYLSGSQTGINYKLYRNATFMGISITGTGAALDFGLLSLAGNYTIIATNTVTGCENTMNGSASIIVNPLPASYIVRLSDSTICTGDAGIHAFLSGSATGTLYQLNISGTPTGFPVAGTGSTIDFGSYTTAGTYSINAVDGITSCATTMTGSPVLIVNPLPAAQAMTGGGGFCTGTPGARIGLSSSQSGIDYQLFIGSIASGGSVPGTGTAIDFGLKTSASYTAIATNPITGCSRTMTGSITVSANPLPTAYNISSSGTTYCSGGPGVLVSLSSSSTGISYQLYNGTAPVGTALSGTGTALNFGNQLAGNYIITATNTATGCTNNMTGIASITASTSPAAFNVTGTGAYCSGGGGRSVILSSSGVGITYTVYHNGVASGSTLSGTGGPLDFGPRFDSGSYLVKATNSLNGCTSWMTDSAMIAINSLPVRYTVTGGGNYCAGDSGVHIRLSGTQAGMAYQLHNGFSVMGLTYYGTGAGIDFGLVTVPASYSVRATDLGTGCFNSMINSASVAINALPTPYAVVGGGSYCAGGTGLHIGLASSTPGISYRLANGAAVLAVISGTGAAIDFGLQTAAGTYTVAAINPASGCLANMSGSATITVIPTTSPSVTLSVSPGDTICTGIPVTYSATVTGGGTSPILTWMVNGSVVGSGTGYTYTPANGDIVSITATSTAACAFPATVSANRTMTVRPNPSISGSTRTCVGTSTNLSGTPGGIWTTSNPSIANVATIGTTLGVLTGMSAGSTTISYSLLGCTSVIMVTVNTPPTITVSSSPASCGGYYTLAANGGISYSWLPASGITCTNCAITNARPPATTTYTVTGTDAKGCSSRAMVNLNGNRISGHISYTGGSAGDVFKVWLIYFNASDSTLTGMDSTFSCMESGIPYFEFLSRPSGNYMVKARLMSAIPGTSGYLPTYSLSTPYWFEAATAVHTNATDTLHINMIYGTVPPGPVFIGGSIASGAGKGTSGTVAVGGMLVYLKDAFTNKVLTSTYTDADGNYSFRHIAEGNYIVYPEEFLYRTTASAVITLSPGADSARDISFRQYTTSRRIVPLAATSVAAVSGLSGNISIYPNPSHGMLNISWKDTHNESATITVTDITGRTVYNSSFSLTPPGDIQADLSTLKAGIYIINIRAEDINYTQRIVIE